MSLKDYYATCPIPKVRPRPGAKSGDTRKQERAREKRGRLTKQQTTMQQIRTRQRHRCIAQDVSPSCAKRIDDPHELEKRSQGGKVSLENSVGICRPCHRLTDATIGGPRLVFDWPGKDKGEPARADVPGNVTVAYVGKRKRRCRER